MVLAASEAAGWLMIAELFAAVPEIDDIFPLLLSAPQSGPFKKPSVTMTQLTSLVDRLEKTVELYLNSAC